MSSVAGDVGRHRHDFVARHLGERLDHIGDSADAEPPESTALRRLVMRCAISTASPVPVEPSYMEAFATSMPVSAATWVWNSNRYCSVPCAISGW